MKIFVTGATGFVGSATVRELLGAGHRVLGLIHSDAGAKALEATVVRGSLEDIDSLRRGAEASDGVIHTAWINDFANFANSCAIDQAAIKAIGDGTGGLQSAIRSHLGHAGGAGPCRHRGRRRRA